MIEEEIEAQIKITRVKGFVGILIRIGGGKTTSGKTFDICAALNGAPVVRIGDVSYILDMKSFMGFALDEEAKR